MLWAAASRSLFERLGLLLSTDRRIDTVTQKRNLHHCTCPLIVRGSFDFHFSPCLESTALPGVIIVDSLGWTGDNAATVLAQSQGPLRAPPLLRWWFSYVRGGRLSRTDDDVWSFFLSLEVDQHRSVPVVYDDHWARQDVPVVPVLLAVTRYDFETSLDHRTRHGATTMAAPSVDWPCVALPMSPSPANSRFMATRIVLKSRQTPIVLSRPFLLFWPHARPVTKPPRR